MESGSLNGKRILFIAQKFYDYHEQIISQLKVFGADVTFYENKLFREDPIVSKDDLISKVKRILNPNFKENYTKCVLEETASLTFDFLFCIGGFSMTPELVNVLKERNPGIKAFIYFWDSFNVWPYQHLIKEFDKVYSFEKVDCDQHNLSYLPLFYSKKPGIKRRANRDIDIMFVASVGLVSLNRLRIAAEIQELCKEKNLNNFSYILYKTPKHNYLIKAFNVLRKLVDPEYRRFVRSLSEYKRKYNFIYKEPLSSSELNELFSRTKVVLDIPVPDQGGLTIRTIESLSEGCKLITTNSSIINEDFYDEQWISIVDEADIKLDTDFIVNKPMKRVEIYHLSLENWLRTIFLN